MSFIPAPNAIAPDAQPTVAVFNILAELARESGREVIRRAAPTTLAQAALAEDHPVVAMSALMGGLRMDANQMGRALREAAPFLVRLCAGTPVTASFASFRFEGQERGPFQFSLLPAGDEGPAPTQLVEVLRRHPLREAPALPGAPDDATSQGAEPAEDAVIAEAWLERSLEAWDAHPELHGFDLEGLGRSLGPVLREAAMRLPWMDCFLLGIMLCRLLTTMVCAQAASLSIDALGVTSRKHGDLGDWRLSVG